MPMFNSVSLFTNYINLGNLLKFSVHPVPLSVKRRVVRLCKDKKNSIRNMVII